MEQQRILRQLAGVEPSSSALAGAMTALMVAADGTISTGETELVAKLLNDALATEGAAGLTASLDKNTVNKFYDHYLPIFKGYAQSAGGTLPLFDLTLAQASMVYLARSGEGGEQRLDQLGKYADFWAAQDFHLATPEANQTDMKLRRLVATTFSVVVESGGAVERPVY